MRLYLDSNVFISFIKKEVDFALNFRYVDSANFFALCAKEKHALILSDLFFKEVKKIIFSEKEEIIAWLNEMDLIFILVQTCSSEIAKRISKQSGIHLADAIHAGTAIENKSKAIITWNKKDFIKTNNLIQCFTPEEFLGVL
jgi:predicted nucleic acid-binding protein